MLERRILTANILSIGSELTVGDTRDTNAGELARALTAEGVDVRRVTALPDHLDDVREAFRDGLARADMVVSTGGLGPTPDDLTREAISAVCGETPTVDPTLETWLRELWKRRGIPFPELNLKQAWVIPSAEPLHNPNGTAPGWFVRRQDGRLIVALPGPPREMRPMWADEVLPRLQAIGIGAEVASRTYRLTGIGESQVADLLGEGLLRASNPVVATYARVEAVDVRIAAVGDAATPAADLLETTASTVLGRLGAFVWATGSTTWSQAIGARLEAMGWSLSVVELGTAGQVMALLGDVPWLRSAQSMTLEEGGATPGDDDLDADPSDADVDPPSDDLVGRAAAVADQAGGVVGLAVRAKPRGADTALSVAIVTPTRTVRQRRLVFLGGADGRSRAALATAAVLLDALRPNDD